MGKIYDLIGSRRREALDRVDMMPPALRQCVHEFGLPIVEAFIQAGVTSPGAIRNIVRMCWVSAQGTGSEGRGGVERSIDAMLLREGGAPSALSLASLLRHMNSAILPMSPTDAMVDASIRETSRHGLMSKEMKHRVRLHAALRQAAHQHWPTLW